MFNFNKRLCLFVCAATLAFQVSGSVYAQYEVVKAHTVGNEFDVPQKNNEEPYLPTYNDPELPNFSQENSVGGKIEKNVKNFFENRKRKKLSNKDENIENEETNSSDEDAITNENQNSDGLNSNREQIASSSNDQQKVSDKNRFQINADKITYDDTEGNVYAKGNVEIIAKAQGVTLKADDAVLDKTSQTLKLHNNVKIIKGGIEMLGEYMLVDLNEQNILMDNPTMEAYQFVINAQEGYLIANDIQMINGTLKSTRQSEFALETRGFQRYENVAADYVRQRNIDRSYLESQRKQVYEINSKEIVITSYRDHNALLLKGSDVYYNNHKIIRNSDIEIVSDKENTVSETNAPEAGTLRNFGTYIGYGLVYKLPRGQTLKLMPALVYGDSNIGVGIIGRHRTPNSMLEAGYASATTNLVVRGRYKFSDGLSLRYGRNAYMPEGFMGARRSGYAAQLEYIKSYAVPDLGANFNHGVYAGIFSDYQKHNQEEAYCTTRFRYVAELRKSFLEFVNEEQDMSISLSGLAQAAATLYGSGQTAGVARIGPFVTTRFKRWESSIGYMFGGIHGDSPFIFDKYRYGRSSIMVNEKFNFNDKFALGFRATVSPLRDNYEEDLLTESRFYAIFGPQDLKLCLSYDFVRDIAHLDFLFLIGSDSSRINFDKLITKDADGGREKRDFYKSKPVKIEVPENI